MKEAASAAVELLVRMQQIKNRKRVEQAAEEE
jgi:hypothetical protein